MLQWVVRLFGGYEAPRDSIFDVVLTVRVPERSNLMWRGPLLPGRTYPPLEL
jgi:hypothetical protein